MKKIKNALGRFRLNQPTAAFVLAVAAFFSTFFIVICFAIFLVENAIFYASLCGGGILFFSVLFSFLIRSELWAKELPEYLISEAEKILGSNVVSPKLKSLIAQVKTSKGEDGLNELKNWLELFGDYKSLEENLPQLYERQDEVVTEISESISKKNQLRIKLLIL